MQLTEQAWSAIGWIGTLIFVMSFLVKNRSMLHLLGMIGSAIKLAYTLHYELWPLVVNWVLLIGIELAMWIKYRGDKTEPKMEECIKCQH